MDSITSENYFKCTMCFFKCAAYDDLMRHYVKNHQHDPQFRIQCTQSGCGGTFTKWRSFRRHLLLKHAEIASIADEIDRDRTEQSEEEMRNINDIRMEQDDEHQQADPESSVECFEWYAAQFVVNIRENCKISHTAIDHIIDGVIDLVQVYSAKIIEELGNRRDPITQLIQFEDVKNIHREKYPPSSLFSSVRSKKALDKILSKKFDLVLPQEHVIGTGLQWKNRKNGTTLVREICDVNYSAYIVPFLKNLENLLKNEEIRTNIDNATQAHENGVFRTVLDGSYYRENNLSQRHMNALAIILYYDDLGIANPLGSASKTHKMSMFYWTLANIHPDFRSAPNAIQLYAIIKTEYLKKPNVLEKLLQPFISDIKELQTNGIDINVNGQMKIFKGFLLFCAGDTPAAAMLGGFKESVSAYRPCRSCMVTSDQWKNHFRESNFPIRNKLEHQKHVEAVSDESTTKAARAFWQKTYGVNKNSPLMEIVDVTKCLPQDVMHIVIEGPLQITCKYFLRYCILELNLFTIDDLNNNLVSFDFKHFRNDKPALVHREHLTGDDSSLRQTAGQIITLAHTLPFLIGEWIMAHDSEILQKHIYCYVTLLQILNLCLAYEIDEESVDLLARMIEVFNWSFQDLYPDSIVPKFHFMTHLPRYIRLFGPARQQWCFRFEATHAYFKGLVPVVRNFKNMPLTLSYRHQARLCSRLASRPGMPSRKILYKGDYVTPGETVLLCNLPNAGIFHGMVEEADWFTCQMIRSKKIIVHGTVYKPSSIILLTCDEHADLPVFGEVDEIFNVGDMNLLIVSILESVLYEFKLNAYHVKKSVGREKCVRNVRNLIFPHPLSSFSVMNNTYVPLINYKRVEFY